MLCRAINGEHPQDEPGGCQNLWNCESQEVGRSRLVHGAPRVVLCAWQVSFAFFPYLWINSDLHADYRAR
jgi:hypothetical protein